MKEYKTEIQEDNANNGKYTFAFIFLVTVIVVLWLAMCITAAKNMENYKKSQIENTNK